MNNKLSEYLDSINEFRENYFNGVNKMTFDINKPFETFIGSPALPAKLVHTWENPKIRFRFLVVINENSEWWVDKDGVSSDGHQRLKNIPEPTRKIKNIGAIPYSGDPANAIIGQKLFEVIEAVNQLIEERQCQKK